MYALWRRSLRHSATWRAIPRARLLSDVVAQCASAADVSESVARKRVFGIAAHIDAGKTTACEAILHASGALRRSRMGRVDSGDTALDFLPAERERGITISAACATLQWRGHRIFLVDSPGHLDFTFEVERALRVMDAVVVLIDAVAGVQAQTETVWRQADRAALPRLLVVNKMDREGARLYEVLQEAQKQFGVVAPLVQMPLYDGGGKFVGVMDLVSMRAREGEIIPGEMLNDAVMERAGREREALVEAAADVDDDIMALFLDEQYVPADVLRKALRAACARRELVPVLCAAALKDVGVREVMDAAVDYLPAPSDRAPLSAVSNGDETVSIVSSPHAPFLAQAFKVTHDDHKGRLVFFRVFSGTLQDRKHPIWNCNKQMKERSSKWLQVLADEYEEKESLECGDVFAMVGLRHTETGDTITINEPSQAAPNLVFDGMTVPLSLCSVALETDSPSEQRSLETFLQMRLSEDPSLRLENDENTGELVLHGVGELQLEHISDRARSELSIELRASRPRVAYRERGSRAVRHVESYDETIGNARLIARVAVSLDVQPGAAAGSPNIVRIDESWTGETRDAVLKSAHAALARGARFGMRTADMTCNVAPADDGAYSLPALRACVAQAVRCALAGAEPVVVEPVMDVEIKVPLADASKVVQRIVHPVDCRGVVSEQVAMGDVMRIVATVPLDGMFGWATTFRSICRGRGDYTMRFKEYTVVPESVIERIKSRL